MAADMHIEGRRTAAQHVIVDRGDLEAVLDQRGQHRIDFGFQQHEIAHDHGAAMRRLEGEPAAEGERGLDGHAVERDGEVAARETVAMDVAGYRRLAAEARHRPCPS